MFRTVCLLSLCLLTPLASAELKVASIFGDHMVLQRQMPTRVWGWTTPGQDVSVLLKSGDGRTSRTSTAKAGEDGRFDATLDALEAGGPFTLTISADETKVFNDVLIGEVWICSGQSNMRWPVAYSNDADLETLTAKYPNIRLITVPNVGTQELQNDFKGEWGACTPESVEHFSAVGYFFGRQLHQTLDVPIGLIDNAWGGSACEAWLRRDVLEADGRFDELIERWKDVEANYDETASTALYDKKLEKWKETKQGKRPRAPRNPLVGQNRPGNLFAGVLNPTIGYTMRGVIWYQGESNSGRAYQYRDLFPLMIQHWRDEWKQGDFPFYWVQLADYRAEASAPGGSDWAELREAQTMTLSKLPATGEAVILNLGEAADIHPKNKQDVAKRLVRLALANDYGLPIVARSPLYKTMAVQDNKIVLTFDHVGGGLDTFDVREPIGFTIAGKDQKFAVAKAKVTSKNTIEVWAESVKTPVAVRYAWADNPVCNMQNQEGLPVTPFRTDDWKGVTAGKAK